MMKHEKSCGAVIFRKTGSGVLYLVEEMMKGHHSMCKGHVEAGETEHETARREIREETGLTVSFLNGFRETDSYSPAPGVVKQVVFYLAEATGGTEKPQPEEVKAIRWLPFEEAHALLTYETDRKILRDAEDFRALPERLSFVKQAESLMRSSIGAVMPGEAVRAALRRLSPLRPGGRNLLVAVGKAAWEMADAACGLLGDEISEGFVVTKYGHSRGDIPRCRIFEAGHPVADEKTFRATEEILSATDRLREEDRVLFLVSGGGSALFEKPLIEEAEYLDVTERLLRSGLPIGEFNAVRKHLSAVKGGRFAAHCLPASVFAVLLSDVLGDRPDVIASGPVSPDASTSEEALSVLKKAGISLSPEAEAQIRKETPKETPNAECVIAGSVRFLCEAAADAARSMGYEPVLVTDRLEAEAKEAGKTFASLAISHTGGPKAYIAGGETVVRVTGNGLGGRCQETAVACAEGIKGLSGRFFFSFGSDGTDGPTDAAGGYADGETAEKLEKENDPVPDVLKSNDSYHALEKIGQLLMTGPTGTNVNDLCVLFCR